MKLQELEGEARKAVTGARELAEKADTEGRSMSPDERAAFDQHMAKGKDLAAQIHTLRADQAVLAEAKSLAELIGPDAAGDVEEQGSDRTGDPRSKGGMSLGRTFVTSAQYKSMMDRYGGVVSDQASVSMDPVRVKSLFTGASETSAGAFVSPEFSNIFEPLGRRELRLRDLISVRRTSTDVIYYVTQTSHTNNAAVVAEATSSAQETTVTGGVVVNVTGGGYKPEGAWAFATASTTVRTIAEWVPVTRRALADAAQLEGLINDELRMDIAEREEAEILDGDGTGEHFDGIQHVTGTQTQAWSTDLFTTTRKALTKARTVGRVRPNGWVFSPADVETLELLRNAEGNFYNGGPYAAGVRTLWGIPYVDSEALTAGQGILGDFKKAVLWDREQTTIRSTDSHGQYFTRNILAILAEERAAFAVTRPSAFVLVDLTA